MKSADFLISIVDYTRSQGSPWVTYLTFSNIPYRFFYKSLPLCTHCQGRDTISNVKTTHLLIGPFRLSLTREVLSAATHPNK